MVIRHNETQVRVISESCDTQRRSVVMCSVVLSHFGTTVTFKLHVYIYYCL